MAKRPNYTDMILDLVEAHGCSMTINDIAHFTGAARSTALKLCRAFHDDGTGELIYLSTLERAFRLANQPLHEHHTILDPKIAKEKKLLKGRPVDECAHTERIPSKTTYTKTDRGTTLVRFGSDHRPAHDGQRHHHSWTGYASSIADIV